MPRRPKRHISQWWLRFRRRVYDFLQSEKEKRSPKHPLRYLSHWNQMEKHPDDYGFAGALRANSPWRRYRMSWPPGKKRSWKLCLQAGWNELHYRYRVVMRSELYFTLAHLPAIGIIFRVIFDNFLGCLFDVEG